MADLERSAVILLAGGLSRRFGPEDKLLSHYQGLPLIEHAARAIAPLPFGRKIAVVRSDAPLLRERLAPFGFAFVENDAPEEGLARSITLGIAQASKMDAAVLALGDMPRIPASHLEALCLGVAGSSPVMASFGLGRPTVPAAFAASVFGELTDLKGDRGAQALLSQASLIPIDPALMLDIDEQGSPAAR
jgi:molybdenum cofactor cytidylyltransferase